MARKGLRPLVTAIGRLRGWRSVRRARYLDRKHNAGRSGTSDQYNHMYR